MTKIVIPCRSRLFHCWSGFQPRSFLSRNERYFLNELIASKSYELLKVTRKLIIEPAKYRNPKRVSLSLS